MSELLVTSLIVITKYQTKDILNGEKDVFWFTVRGNRVSHDTEGMVLESNMSAHVAPECRGREK